MKPMFVYEARVGAIGRVSFSFFGYPERRVVFSASPMGLSPDDLKAYRRVASLAYAAATKATRIKWGRVPMRFGAES